MSEMKGDRKIFYTQLVLSTLTLMIVFILLWELIADRFFAGWSIRELHFMYLSRGIVLGVIMAVWAAFFIIRNRSGYEQKLERQTQFITTLLDSMREAIFVINEKCDLITMNRTAEELFSEKIKEDPQWYRKLREDSMKGNCGEKMNGVSKLEVCYEIQGRHYRVYSSPVAQWEEDKAKVVIEVFRDITEEIEIEKKMIQSEKAAAIGFLASGLLHEIGNPLSSMHSLVQLLRRKEEDAKKSEKLRLLRNHIERIVRILRDLGNLRGRGKKQKEIETRSLEKIVKDVLRLVRYDRRSGQIEIEVDLKEEDRFLLVKKIGLDQVLLNLVLNALDTVSKENGKICLCGSRQGKELKISVEDNGEGISMEDQKKIFEPFYTTKEVGRGTGLGLYVSKNLCEEEGGRLELIETGPGKTIFEVSMALEKEELSSGTSKISKIAS